MDTPTGYRPRAKCRRLSRVSMFTNRNRNLKLDLFALALLAVVVLLVVSLVTYHPADMSSGQSEPLAAAGEPLPSAIAASGKLHNACGRWGAIAADLLFTGLGICAYALVVSLAIVDWKLLRRQRIDTPVLRAVGWLLSLVGLATLATLLLPNWSPAPDSGGGGLLGAWGSQLVLAHFALTGGLILATTAVIAGMVLCTDYFVFRTTGKVLRVLLSAVGLVRIRRRAVKTTRNDVDDREVGADDLDEEFAEDSEDEADDDVPIRFRGKRPAADDSDEADDEEGETDEYEETDDEIEGDDEAELTAESAAISNPAQQSGGPHFRIRKKPEKDERQLVMSQLDDADLGDELFDYELPDIDLLLEGDDVCYNQQEKEVRRKAKILEKTFAEFGFQVKVVEIETGPVIAQYEVQLEAGLRLSKITGLADDLAIALRVPSVRIVAPIPGKNTVGIEVPNESRQIVRLREVMEEAEGKTKKMRIPIFLGKDVSGNPLVVDLSTLPHLLIAGRTGTGKSVCLNAIISSILMTRRPDEVRMLLIDPKMVELSGYGRLPHLMHPVVTDMRKAEAILAWAVEKMEERYALLARAGVRHISSYNQLGEEELVERLEPETDEEREAIPLQLPFIVIVADEMADLMMTAGKDVEQHIIRLAQKSRAVGIHLILATQKPTVDVITGLIKSNLPARIAFQVASRTDSRVVLDEMGADKLLGNGDMLFLWPGTSTLLRGQGTYLSDDEIDSVCDACSTGEQHFVKELVNMKVQESDDQQPGQLTKRDELYESAVDVVVREGRGSVSLLQRALGIGYGRAARLIDYMAEDGIVGPYAGSQAREVTITLADWERMQSGDKAPAEAVVEAPPAKRRRSNKIRPEPDPAEEDSWEEEEGLDADEDAAAVDEPEYEEDEEEELLDEDDSDADDDEEADEEDDWEEDDTDEEYAEDEYEDEDDEPYAEDDEEDEDVEDDDGELEDDEQEWDEDEYGEAEYDEDDELPPKRRYEAESA